MRVGLLGGSFDPIHVGHISLARAAQRQLKLPRIYFVVAKHSPFKSASAQTPAAVRAQLVRRALQGNKSFRVALWELKRRGPSYTVDTLRAYKKAHPRDEVFFITGSDALAGFKKWKNPSAILKLAQLVVGRRPGAKLTLPHKNVITLKGRFPNVSSTGLRSGSTKGLPAGVAALIKKRGLYR
jgi:nicotinate-nucleotide adenylyltransferase